MRMRSAVIIESENQVALIRRVRDHHTYFLFPGGGVEPNETVEDAAVREACEELGVHVQLEQLVAVVRFHENIQYYYTATIVSGEFGTGTGDEFNSAVDSLNGSYSPVWLPVSDLHRFDVRPGKLAGTLQSGSLLTVGSPMVFSE